MDSPVATKRKSDINSNTLISGDCLIKRKRSSSNRSKSEEEGSVTVKGKEKKRKREKVSYAESEEAETPLRKYRKPSKDNSNFSSSSCLESYTRPRKQQDPLQLVAEESQVVPETNIEEPSKVKVPKKRKLADQDTENIGCTSRVPEVVNELAFEVLPIDKGKKSKRKEKQKGKRSK